MATVVDTSVVQTIGPKVGATPELKLHSSLDSASGAMLDPETIEIHTIQFGLAGIFPVTCSKKDRGHKHDKRCQTAWGANILGKYETVASAFGAFHKYSPKADFFISHSGLIPSRENLEKMMGTKKALLIREFTFALKSSQAFDEAALLFFVLFMGCQFSPSDDETKNRPMSVRFRREKLSISIMFPTEKAGNESMAYLRKTDSAFALLEKSCEGGCFTVQNFFNKKKSANGAKGAK